MKHNVSQFSTAHGTQVVCIDVPGASACDIKIAVRAGYRIAVEHDESKPETPHLLEHMVFEGSRKYPSSDELLDVFSVGVGEANGFTNSYHNVYAFHTRPANFERVFEAAVDMVFHPLLEEKGFIEEREVVRNEHLGNMSDFEAAADMYVGRLALGHSVVPPDIHLQLLDGPTLEDVREYHAKYYTQSNTAIVVCRNFKGWSRTRTKRWIEDALRDVAVGEHIEFPRLVLQKPESQFIYLPTGRNHGEDVLSLQFIYDNDPTDEEQVARNLFCLIASNMKTYSINYQLRKKGLVYGLSVSGSQSLETYSIEVSIMTQHEKFPEVFAHTLERLRQLAYDGISEAQFEYSKQELIGSLSEAITSANEALNWYMDEYLLFGRCSTPEDMTKVLTTMTQARMLEIVQGVIDPDRAYGTLMSGRPKRTMGVVVTLFDRILRKQEPVTATMLADATILLGKRDHTGYRILSIVMSVVGTALLLPQVVRPVFGTGTIASSYDLTLYFYVMIGILALSMLLIAAGESYEKVQRHAFAVGCCLLLFAGIFAGFMDDGIVKAWGVSSYLHLLALIVPLGVLIVPNIGAVITMVKERRSK